MPAPLVDPGRIEPALRRAYPTRVFEELDLSAVDEHLAGDRLTELFHQVASVPGASAVMELEVVKSHILHVGVQDAPDWERLNRELTPRQRVAAVAEGGGALLYWNILLSRLGPYWCGYWNVFRQRDGRVFPQVTGAGDDARWTEIRERVAATLASSGLREVGQPLLDAPVRWLVATRSELSDPQGVAPRPTVYDALFSDVY